VRPGEHLLELEALDAALEREGGLRRLGAGRLVLRLLGELVQGAGVLEPAPGAVEAAEGGVELRLLLQQPLRPGVVVPEGGVLGQAGDLGGAPALPLDVKATPGARRGAASGLRAALRSVRPSR